MNKKMTVLASSVAFLGLGMSMPSCPGQQEMQQKIDSMQAQQVKDSKKIAELEKALTDFKAAVANMGNVDQKISELKAEVAKALQDQAAQTDQKIQAMAPKSAARGGARTPMKRR